MPTPRETIEAFEMSKFGLNPEVAEDVQQWLDTAPVDPDKPVEDYSGDAFAFGSQQPEPPEQRAPLYPRMPGH